MKNIQQTDLLGGHTVAIYDSKISIAKTVHACNPRNTTLYTREKTHFSEQEILVHEHLAASAAGLCSADVCMLDGDALKVLAVRYPSDAQFVLARITWRGAWILGFLGLLRRLLLGRVTLGGVFYLKDLSGNKSWWLLVNKTKKTVASERLLIARGKGVEDFLNWLRTEKINYVVPRFYEKLPQQYREGGDIDLIVADDDVEKVVTYIREHAGTLTGTSADSVPIGLHSVSLGAGVPYYPPPIATAILERAIDGPAGSRIPTPLDTLNALIYHALYHGKGYSTNIPTTLAGKPENPPENDYGKIIQEKAAELGVVVGHTMEEMDEYMAQIGWRPRRDTLAKIAEKNPWVRDRFFSERNSGATGLTVFVVKEKALVDNLQDDIVRHLNHHGLHILRTQILSEEQKSRAVEHIRGGNWSDEKGNIDGLRPAALIIGIDYQCANLPPAYAGEYERTWSKRRKQQIRNAFDTPGVPSVVHAADNTAEAWEYIEICFPEEVEEIRQQVESFAQISLMSRWRRFFSPTYISHAFKFKLRDLVTNRL